MIVTVVSSNALPLGDLAGAQAVSFRPPAGSDTFARIVQVLGTDAEEYLSEIDESYDTRATAT